MHPGIVSVRVDFFLRCTEICPELFDSTDFSAVFLLGNILIEYFEDNSRSYHSMYLPSSCFSLYIFSVYTLTIYIHLYIFSQKSL